jgi:AraC-like DNA-binding protein/mannose-6-phosphate isomerase-like protein (cupin superfamily)
MSILPLAAPRCLAKERRISDIRQMSVSVAVADRGARLTNNAEDFQAIPRAIAAMPNRYAAGFRIAPHVHPRDQLLYAASGVMRVETDRAAWIVPPDRAVYLPAGTRHSVVIRGELEMRSLYIDTEYTGGIVRHPSVVEVSDLLRALILALAEEPILYDEDGRGGLIVRLILIELAAARRLPLMVPMPADRRLRRICDALLANPENDATLEIWATTAGASARTLARLFQRQLNMGFGAWRQRVRFHNAVEALVAGQPIGRVARNNGYRSPSAFSAAFRKAIGVPPSAIKIGG